MKISLRKVSFVLLVFIYIFAPPLLPIGTSIIMGGAFIIYFACNYYRIHNNLFGKQIFIVYFIFIIFVAWAILSYIYIYGNLENILPFLVNYVYLLFYSILGAVVICDLIVKFKFQQDKIWKYLIYVGCIQGILAILALVNVHVQDFCCILLENIMSKEMIDYWRNYRLYGLACSLTYTMPIVQALLGGLAILYAKKYNEKFYFFVPLLWGSAIINARVAMVVIAIEILTIIFTNVKKKDEYKLIKKSTFCITMFLMMGILVLILIAVRRGVSFARITDPILEIISLLKGNVVFRTEGYLAYFFYDPKTFVIPTGKEFLWGGGIWNNTSDIGYLHNLWIGGIFYCIFLYGTYIIYLKKMYKSLKRTKSDFYSIIIMLGISMFIVNIKGDIFGGMNEVQNLFFLVLGIILFIKRKEAGGTFE